MTYGHDSDTAPRIGRNIARARKARGLTQSLLAQRIPCSKSLVAQVERGHKPASPSFTAGAARALNVRLGQLTGQPYEDPHRGRVHTTIPGIQRSMLSWDLPEEDLPARSLDALAADVARISALGRKARYGQLGEALPALLDELAVACHTAVGADRRRGFGLLAEAYSSVTAIAYVLGLFDLRSQAMDRVQWAARESDDHLRIARTQWQRSTLFLHEAAYSQGRKLLDRVRHDLGEDIAHMDPATLSVHAPPTSARRYSPHEPPMRVAHTNTWTRPPTPPGCWARMPTTTAWNSDRPTSRYIASVLPWRRTTVPKSFA